MTKKKTYVEGILDILVARKLIDIRDAESMKYSFIERAKGVFSNFLLEEGIVEKPDLLKALEAYYEVPSFDVEGFFFDTFLLRKFPKDELLRYVVIPVEVDEDIMTVVAADPDNEEIELMLRDHVSYDIVFNVGLTRDITDAVKEYYDSSDTADEFEERLELD